MADFVTAVSRFNGRSQPKSEAIDDGDGNSNNNGDAPAQDTDTFVDMPLARKAWEWLVERPEILVSRNGDRDQLSLDDALALPEPQPPVPVEAADDDAEEQKVDVSAASLKVPAKDGKRRASRGPKSMADVAAAAAAAAENDDPNTRPRLYATEKTIWYTLTGHDVDYKKVPMLEWKCLQGIASARTKGILQADLRELVDQDKRSVPKRTDFLAAKGYAVKRTTIARGYRTSMLWLTEFAPIELEAGAAEPTATEDDPTPSLLSSKDLASNGIDFSPEFLTKNLEPVPWRNRWIGDAIEFASFGQTILAIVKAWGVIRVVDLKLKLGIMGLRWQMRTLARASREFVASGILRFVAAMRADERQLFKDCIKYERDPTPGEWAVYLAAGRRRAPITELRAKRKKEQGRLQYGGASGGGDDQNELDMAALEEEDEDELGAAGSLIGINDAARKPAWALDVPLANLIYETVDRAGIDGITSPEICRATLGSSFARYIFSLVTAMSRPGNQPDHLIKFQLHCEPSRVGKNKAYLFRTLENAKLAERLSNGESIESIEQEAADAAAEGNADAKKFWDLYDTGKLFDLPAEELRRLYGFAPIPPPMTAAELEAQEVKFTTPHVRKRTGRPRKGTLKGKGVEGDGAGGVDADGNVIEIVDAGTPPPKRKRGRPPKVREVEVEVVDIEMVDAEGNANNGEANDVKAISAPATPKKRGRPPKAKPADTEANGAEDKEVEAVQPKPSPPKRGRGRPPKKKVFREKTPAEPEEDDTPAANAEGAQVPGKNEDAEHLPTVRLGEPGSLCPKTGERRGRRRRSIVVIFRLQQLRDRDFLANERGYKEGAIRIEPGENDEGEEAEADESGRSDSEDDGENDEDEQEEQVVQDEQARSEAALAEIKLLATDLEPVASHDNGKLGHLAVDLDSKTLKFTYAVARRGRRPVHPKEPITIATDNLVGDPVIRRAPGGDGQAFVLEAREAREGENDKDGDKDDNNEGTEQEATPQDGTADATWPFVFILDDEAGGNDKHAATLRDVLVALRAHGQPQEQDGGDAAPARRRGRLPGKKDKKPGIPAEEGPKEFVCETCSGVWKNLLGLQYHQTKARTACNPNYVPISAEEKEAKKKQQREEREQERQQAEQAEIAESRGGRALRERKQPVGAFREVSPVSLASTRSHSPSPSVASETSTPSLSPKKDGRQPLKVHGNRRRPYRLQDSESSDGDRADRPRGVAGAAMVWLDSTEGSSQPEDVAIDTNPLDVPSIPVSQPDLENTPMEDAGEAGEEPAAEWHRGNPPAPVEVASQQQSFARAEASRETPVHTEAVATPPSSAAPPRTPSAATTPARSVIDTPNKAGPAGFRMPPLPKNGTKLSPFALRSYIVMEITKYLVDYFGGIFPGDRSLWYTAFHIYTRTFPGEDPPTLTVIKAAVKKLEMAKEVEEHTFGFRDPRGQFIYCRLLARPGTDLFSSATAGDFKMRIQAAFPQPYVPADFAPSEKDMAILRILDKDSGRNSRGRRQLQPEIEVLKAPFYEQPQAARPAANTVLLVGYGDEEDGDTYQQKAPNGKRRATLTAGDLIGGSSAEHTPKRRRTKYVAPAAENSLLRALGNYYGGEGLEMYDNEADIDPALRTVKTQTQTGNPGLDSLPASFFLSEDDIHRNRSKTKPAKLRADGADGFTTYVYFLPPNTRLEDGQDEEESIDYDAAGKRMPGPAEDRPPPRAYKIVTKTQVLYDMRKKSPRAWPIVTETTFQRHSDASFTMDGFMPTRKALVRANLPRTAAECASMLRANHKFPEFNDTPEGAFHRDLVYCQSWEVSQSGTDLLRNPSVAPRYVFLNLAFPGTHYTAEDAEAQAAGKPVADTYAHPPLRWVPKNLYTVNTIPYGMLDGDDSALNNLAPTTPAQRKKWARSSSELAVLREKQAQQAKYVMSSRREMTVYPQKPADYVHHLPASASAAGGMDWTANDTLVAAFVVVRTLLGGLGQTIDWGLMMRLFPDKRLSALRNFWKNTRRERQPHVDKFTERFQQAFIEAYERQELPPLDYENILAYDWGWLVGWALRLMRHDANALPATREALEESHTLVDLPLSRMAGWREDFFHISRSVWNRLHDTASEPAAMAIDKLLPVTPTEAVAGGAVDELRHMVARSWIRALCGTPHARYQPSSIKRKLLTLGSLGTSSTDSDNNVGVLDEAATNNLLQTVIGNLTTDRILRRTKSMIALGGRMYTLTEAYDNVLEKAAMEDKFRQAFAFKTHLDACFRQGNDSAYEIPVDTNDDGMIMALMNLQAHGRVIVEAMDAPHIPFGFEPGNYESRKFPKHYQRFRTRIVLTDKYVYNDNVDLAAMLQQVVASVTTDGGAEEAAGTVLPPPPRMGPHEEMPIWRDFFGILDRKWFARLAGAVVFLLATRGATPIRQTAAHLRPIIEPFEVQMLMDWATDMSILEGDSGKTKIVTAMDTVDHPPNSRAVSEWWWLLVGQVYAASDVPVADDNGRKQLNNGGEKTGGTTLADIDEEAEEVEDEEGEDEYE